MKLLQCVVGYCDDCGEPIYYGATHSKQLDGEKLLCRSCAEHHGILEGCKFLICDECGKYYNATLPNGNLDDWSILTSDIDGANFCSESCAISHGYVKCYGCGDWIKEEDSCRKGGEYLCINCEDDYFECDCCGHIFHIDNQEIVRCTDEYVCQNCAENNYYRCDDCRELFPRDCVTITHNRDYICDDCYGSYYFTCSNCEEVYHIDDEREDPNTGDSVCINCYDECRCGVMDYHDFDSSSYKRRKCCGEKNPITFGVELECDDGRFSIDDFEDYINDGYKIHFERDGSLSHKGVECISQPCSLKYHQEKFEWEKILNILKNQGFKSHNTETCGLHIHIGRKQLTSSQIIKMDVFVNHGREFFAKIARRETFYGRGGHYDITKKADPRCPSGYLGNHFRRYTAVNTTNYNTVELRIFKGSLKYNTFIGTIEMCHALVNFVNLISLKEIYDTEHNIVKFVEYMWKNRKLYPHVFQMMYELVDLDYINPQVKHYYSVIKKANEMKENKKCA